MVVGSTPTVGANMLILNDNINLFGKNRTAHLPVAQCDLCDFFRCKFKQKRIISENDFLEVYIDSTLETCEHRDVKGLYKKARLGEIKDFTGVSSPYDKPDSADIHINTNKSSISESVELLFKQLNSKL